MQYELQKSQMLQEKILNAQSQTITPSNKNG
jgi:hypothetical protein